ncbi:ComF family protein [soil metagenome]
MMPRTLFARWLGTGVDSEFTSRFRQFGRSTFDLLTDIVFPPTCAGCGSLGDWLCARCIEKLGQIDLLHEPYFRTIEGSSARLTARFTYADPVRRAIHLLKYSGERARAIWFAEQIVPLLEFLRLDHAVLEPIPLTPARERSRGFNQSREISLHLENLVGVPVGGGLSRIRETRPQVELNGHERIINVRGAFEASSQVAGMHVILLDDVVTTGSTMRECAAACYTAGAASVVGVAVASGA